MEDAAGFGSSEYRIEGYSDNNLVPGYTMNVIVSSVQEPTFNWDSVDEIRITAIGSPYDVAATFDDLKYEDAVNFTAPTVTSQAVTDITQTTATGNGNITGLTANTTYYVRAYATNNEGTSYGSQISFTTAKVVTPPIIDTTSPSVISLSPTDNAVNVGINNNFIITFNEKAFCGISARSTK